jgi:3-hydroxyacyl-CoA dehydrogenase
MKYADMVGLEKILSNIEKFSQEDKRFWSPTKLLQDLVNKGKNFDSLN